MFDHAWRQVKEKFYDPDIHGVDWDGYRETYGKFLPYITNNFDFAEMLGEMLGELNGSHTGARYYGGGASYPTAYLGVFLDDTYEGDGLKIKEIIKRSPLTQFPNDVKPGCIIEKIDGEPVLAGQDYYPLLEGKVGERIRLSVYDPETSKRFDVEIKGLGSESSILYQRWVERNRAIVDSISGGKIGYVHIQGMDSPSFRTLYSELLGRLRQKDAVVVDTVTTVADGCMTMWLPCFRARSTSSSSRAASTSAATRSTSGSSLPACSCARTTTAMPTALLGYTSTLRSESLSERLFPAP